MANISITATTCGGGDFFEYIVEDSSIDITKVYQLPTGRCVTISSTATTLNGNYAYLYGPYDDCTDCISPLSANTEYVECVVCSGATSTIEPPHPVYTNGQNKAVVQLNAVVIGGNGLNS